MTLPIKYATWLEEVQKAIREQLHTDIEDCPYLKYLHRCGTTALEAAQGIISINQVQPPYQ